MKKTISGWVALNDVHDIAHSDSLLPYIYLQRTKPTVYRGGGKLKMVRCKLTFDKPAHL